MTIHIPDFSKINVLVIGDIVLDRYWRGKGNASRLSPEAPVPVVCFQDTYETPGAASNVAMNIASLGGKVTLLGVVGQDDAADRLEQMLTAQGIHSQLMHCPHISTIVKLRVLERNQQLVRIDFEEEMKNFEQAELLKRFESLLNGIDVVVLSDYNKGTLRYANDFIHCAKQKNIPVLVGPKSKDFDLYRGATIVIPNLVEFYDAAGSCCSEAEIIQKGRALIESHEIQHLLITRGPGGMSLLSTQEEPYYLPALAREVFDVTGAGDTTLAVLSAGLAAGLSLCEAMQLANAAASVVVRKVGVATVELHEIRQVLQQGFYDGLLEEEELISLIRAVQKRGAKVVMTNGCFDILHLGHVHYLEQAKALGDYLIVAVNDDDSVRRLKGPSRPVNALKQRMSVLAALKSVDWVVCFSEDTPERLISRVLPNILVKGADWSIEQVVGAKTVLEHGGEVKLIETVEGCSTTKTIDTIVDHKRRTS